MGEINGIFIHNGVPTNNATAKLWEAAGFVSPPEYDDAEPDGGYQVGGDITTGQSYGGDGAYRFASVDDGEYYVSVEYLSHRVWQYYSIEDIDSILTTTGDLLYRHSDGTLKALGIGSNGQVVESDGTHPGWAAIDEPWTVSESVKNANDTERNNDADAYTKIKEIKLDDGFVGDIRIKFDMKTSFTSSASYGKIYRNGSPLGSERTTLSGSYVTFSEDFSSVDWSPDDLIQIYAHNTNPNIVYIQNFRLCYEADRAAEASTNQDP
jgi:hypothetical protein